MADYEDSDLTGDQEGQDPPAAPSPALQQFREVFDAPGIAPEARDLAHDQTTVVNDYFQRRDLAIANERAGQAFVDGVDRFKSGLVSGVQSDPHFLDTALLLADMTIDGMVSALPNAPDGPAHRDELIRHTQSEIAAAAITAAAEQNEGLARGMLAHPRVAGLLGEATGPLDTYISMQAQARATDNQAEMELLQRRASEATDRSAINYLGALHDPQTDGVRFPPGWNQAVLADNRLPPAAKVAVAGIYNQLRTEGDAPASDPFLLAGLTSRIASNDPPPVADIAQMIGHGLKAADAMLLLGGAGPGGVQARREFNGLAATLDAANRVLASPENGPAGAAAFARFTGWLMPAYRQAGPGSLNPLADNSILPSGDGTSAHKFWNHFSPRLDDYVVNERPPGGRRTERGDTLDEPEILRQQGVPGSPVGDEVIYQPRIFRDPQAMSPEADLYRLRAEKNQEQYMATRSSTPIGQIHPSLSQALQAFAPTPSDFADAATGINIEPLGSMARSIAGPINRSRKSLDKIFSGERDLSTPWVEDNPGGADDEDEAGNKTRYPLRTSPGKGPWFGVERRSEQMKVGAGAQNIGAGYAEPTEVITDTGIKQLTAHDLATQASAGPRPFVTGDQQDFIDGGPQKGKPRGRPPRNLPANPRRRR